MNLKEMKIGASLVTAALKCNGLNPATMKGCESKDITHIDNKGFIYCEHHGEQRKKSVPCRKLKPAELQTLQSGQPITRY